MIFNLHTWTTTCGKREISVLPLRDAMKLIAMIIQNKYVIKVRLIMAAHDENLSLIERADDWARSGNEIWYTIVHFDQLPSF